MFQTADPLPVPGVQVAALPPVGHDIHLPLNSPRFIISPRSRIVCKGQIYDVHFTCEMWLVLTPEVHLKSNQTLVGANRPRHGNITFSITPLLSCCGA
jgi:hypothetical protein